MGKSLIPRSAGEVTRISTTDFAEERYEKGTELAIFKDGGNFLHLWQWLVTVVIKLWFVNVWRNEPYRRCWKIQRMSFKGSRGAVDRTRRRTSFDTVKLMTWNRNGQRWKSDWNFLQGQMWIPSCETKERKKLLIPFIEPVVYKLIKKKKKAYIHLLNGLDWLRWRLMY